MRHPRKPPQLSPIAVPAAAAARLMGAAPSTMRYWCASGIVPARKIGKGWFIRLEELDGLTRAEARPDEIPTRELSVAGQ